MSLGADVAAMLPALRAAAESLMTDTWSCERGAERVFDDLTGVWTSEPGTGVYDGPGRLRDVDSNSPRLVVQGETTVLSSLVLSLPVDGSAGVRVGDVLECVDARDAALVGLKVKVTDLHLQTDSTARRFSVEVESWPTT